MSDLDGGPEKILFSWSGGKDSALALHEVLHGGKYEVSALVTTVTADYDRVSMHGVRKILLEKQARSLGLPLEIVSIPKHATNDIYEKAFSDALLGHKSRGVRTVAFADLFLEDVRAYRETLLQKIDMTGLYPVWKRDTTAFLRDFIRLGFKAVLVCVNPARLDPAFAGREIDANFLRDLPAGVDPCGENGEYHSFVYDGPGFQSPVPFTRSATVLRDGFLFCDLVP